MDYCDGPDADRGDLDQVGPRLKRIRTQRGVTLTALSGATGISKGTLSRLENGLRRPSLELLLPLAHAHRVPLDDLVGAPEVGDPRIRLKPRRANGRTVVPLTKQPGAVQAWKIVIPATQSQPQPRTHDGYEWLYVLTGRCASSSATRTWCWDPVRLRSSTRRSPIGSAAPATGRPRS